MKKVLIGLITYNDLAYLKKSMPVIEELRKSLPATVAVLDTAGNAEIQDWFAENYPEMNFYRHPDGNIGYGAGHSDMLRTFPGYQYYLAHQSDLLFNPATVKALLRRMDDDESIAMCTAKLHYWDFDRDRKTEQIDSLGIAGDRRHHFVDRGQGEVDKGQYDSSLNDAFGISGATFLIRTSVISSLHGNDWQLFDERMWMYKEDVDLAYRLRWMGAKIEIYPEVLGWHARTISGREGLLKSHKGRADYARRHSYKNHLLMLKNNLSWRLGFGVWARVFFYEFLKCNYMFFLHPTVWLDGMKTLLFVPAKRSDKRGAAKDILSYLQ